LIPIVGVDVYTISVGGDERFVTGGKNHIKFWDLPSATSAGGELSSKGGIYGKNIKARSVIAAAYIGADCVTGMDDGSIVLWKERSSTKTVKAHDGPVTAMCSVESSSSGGSVSSGGMIAGMSGGSGESSSPCVISGGKDGFIHVFNAQLVKEWTLDLNLSSPSSALPQVQALSTKDGRILIGTKASEIYEVNRLNTSEIYRYVQGHFGTRAEVWGLAVHPLANRFVTAGDDETVRLWDAKGQQQIGITNVGSKVRALAYDRDGSHVAAATFDGRVVILSADLQSKITEVSVAKSWIQALSYSPDGSTLAVGSHDDNIYLLSTKTYNCRAVCKGHHSYVTALDFSIDGTRLQSCSGDYELLFWDTGTGKQILSATEMRDVEWSTITCTLGWGVQGIWPPGADGTDVRKKRTRKLSETKNLIFLS
jgi:echinoderm microtubule-associated protein-like 6